MDKVIQNQDEMQDEELYALLEKALEQERLCVSEELIQKTLKKIENQGIAEEVSVRKTKKYTLMRYASVAAAAVLVVALGIGMQGGIGRNKASNEAMPECVADRAEEEGAFEYSTNSMQGKNDAAGRAGTMTDSEEMVIMNPSEALADEYLLDEPESGYLESTGITIAVVKETVEEEAVKDSALSGECWELVDSGEDWEAELTEKLENLESENEPLPDTGEYVYMLSCDDGSKATIFFDEPLTRILRIRTEQGTFWCLFGTELRVYKEN